MTRTLTARQQQVLDAIRHHIMRHHVAPSIRELGIALGLRSTSTVHTHIEALRRKGYLAENAGDVRVRNLQLVHAMPCPTCQGLPCPTCQGRGWVVPDA